MPDNIAGARAALAQAHRRYQEGAEIPAVDRTLDLANAHSRIAIAEELHDLKQTLRASITRHMTVHEALTPLFAEDKPNRPAHVPRNVCGKCTDSGAWDQWCTQPIGHAGPCKPA